ncbi:hypothetical protein ACOMHN_006922 [Nucella lapillus]
MKISPERIAVDHTLDDETALNQGLNVTCKVPDAVNRTQIHTMTLWFIAAQGAKSGRRVLLARYNATWPAKEGTGRIDVMHVPGTVAFGGRQSGLIDYRVVKATCRNAGEYRCQLTNTESNTSTASLKFVFSGQ